MFHFGLYRIHAYNAPVRKHSRINHQGVEISNCMKGKFKDLLWKYLMKMK